MKALTAYLFAPVERWRTVLLLRGTLLVLAFDIWRTRLAHGGRYGAGGFNVAHFGWLDAVGPTVTPELYGLVAGVASLLAFALAWVPHRAGVALLAVVYSWTWAMSMLDSYQHHYLLSLVLAAFVAFPAGAYGERDRRRVPASGYAVLAASIALVYAYAAFGKTEAEWLSGAALRRVTAGSDLAPWLTGAADWTGLPVAAVDRAVGHSVVLLQALLAGAYLLAPLRDAVRGWALHAFFALALAVGVSFHLGAEWLNLEIGWFSFYMIAFAVVMLSPAPPGLGAAVNSLDDLQAAILRSLRRPPYTIGVVLFGASLAAIATRGADLPGVDEAGLAVGVLLALALLPALPRGEGPTVAALATVAAVGGFALVGSLDGSDARYDYYRNVGGDARRRGDLPAALDAYERANRHLPAPVVRTATGPATLDDGLAVTFSAEGGVHRLEVDVEVDGAVQDLALAHTWTAGRGHRGGERRHRLPRRDDGTFGGDLGPQAANTPKAGTWRVTGRGAEGARLRSLRILQQDNRERAAAAVRARLAR